MDDILVWGRTWQEHTARLHEVLQRLRDAGALLNPAKCTFGVREIEFLGHTLADGKTFISKALVEALLTTPLPDTKKMLRKALGSFAYVQRWIPGMAEIAKPLHTLLSGDRQKLIWNAEAEKAFQQLKQQVASPPVMHLPDFRRRFVLVTDASAVGIGANLGQRSKDDGLQPVAFHHHTLSAADRNYGTTDRELLAVVLAVRSFRIYLSSREFELVTDHTALKWLRSMEMDDVYRRRSRWLEFLQQFKFTIVHRPGKSPALSMADYLSRIEHGDLAATLQVLAVSIQEEKGDGMIHLSPMFSGPEVVAGQCTCSSVGPVREAIMTA